ncbi:hypothetical protein [Myceligenerans pegani]|uniref:Uncharacterized protein n=1 Tax=Myceligenerans pegani TaxID=2776917 RepID=A0ABR9MWP1_9MICO|nr:hypothetical protein [Myceligenerans sp. TRM 65318]MBE1875803.1 hypothetical protein [Myceligenerans sp. TRM 65318]MBE3018074.1 hypothetical protein [Myceligenerans sp. TRM 65318]
MDILSGLIDAIMALLNSLGLGLPLPELPGLPLPELPGLPLPEPPLPL